jgi:sporulation protein YhbH
MTVPPFTISQADGSLHRQGQQDQTRHQQKVKEAVKQRLHELITDESLILSDGTKPIKVPIHSLEQYRFLFNLHKRKHASLGGDDSKAGDAAGEDLYEVEVEFEDLEDVLFEDWAMPNLHRREHQQLETEQTRFTDVRKVGMTANLDRKRTLLENFKRNATRGSPGFGGFTPDDLRYKTWEPTVKHESSAVIIAMMDTSGSMGVFEKYCARSFFFWMSRFLLQKYKHVENVFIAHHAEAKVVTEDVFFSKGESGGTICSSAYELALELIDSRYDPAMYNLYPFHFSDGDNLSSDNDRCLQAIGELLDRCNVFGYGEVNPFNRTSTLMSAYRNVSDPGFLTSIIRDKGDVLKALRTFFGPVGKRKEG